MASTHLIRVALLAGCASIWIATLACGGGDESTGSATEKAGAAVPMEKGSRRVTVPGPGGKPAYATVVAGEMAADFPDDIPTPPDSEPGNAMFMPGEGGMATFMSKASRSDISAFYVKELPGKGWEVEAPSEEERRTVIKAQKAGRKASVVVVAGADGSEVLITIDGSGS